MSPASGLDEALINKITVCKYRRGDGPALHTTDCSVCLGEFHDGESLRLLPKCSHAFHQQCIDTWLKSHSNCPLCRSNITFVAVEVAPPEPEGCAPGAGEADRWGSRDGRGDPAARAGGANRGDGGRVRTVTRTAV